jgi:hypothetical protein
MKQIWQGHGWKVEKTPSLEEVSHIVSQILTFKASYQQEYKSSYK